MSSSRTRRQNSNLHPGLADAPTKKQATTDIKLHVVMKKKLTARGVTRTPQGTPYALHSSLKGVNIFRPNLHSRMKEFIESDYFKSKTPGKNYIYQAAYGIHGWESKKKDLQKNHNAVEIDTSGGVAGFSSHVRKHGILSDDEEHEHYSIDILILCLENQLAEASATSSSTDTACQRKRTTSAEASIFSSAKKKAKKKKSIFKAPDILKVFVLMPTVTDHNGHTVVHKKEPIFSFRINDFIKHYVEPEAAAMDSNGDDISLSMDESFEIECNDVECDDILKVNTKTMLRNHVGYQIMNHNQKKAVRSYDHQIGEKSELFGGTGNNKNMAPLQRSVDVNDYIRKMALKTSNWSELRAPGTVSDLSDEDMTYKVLNVYLSLGCKQDEDEKVISFFEPTSEDVDTFIGFSQNELDLPSDQHDKKDAAQQTKDRAVLCKEFFAKLYNSNGSILYHGFTSAQQNIMYQAVVNDTSLQKIYCNDVLPKSESDSFMQKCISACSQSKELHGLLPCANKFPPENEDVKVPPSLRYWKCTDAGKVWADKVKKEEGKNTESRAIHTAIQQLIELKKLEMVQPTGTNANTDRTVVNTNMPRISSNDRVGHIVVENESGVDETILFGPSEDITCDTTLFDVLKSVSNHPKRKNDTDVRVYKIRARSSDARVTYTKAQAAYEKIGNLLWRFKVSDGEQSLNVLTTWRAQDDDCGGMSD